MTEDASRPLPAVSEPDTAPFWAATRAHRLTFQRCRDCERVVFYPRARCPHCGGGALAWEESAGTGNVYACTVIRRHSHPFFRSRVPYVLAYVDLDEGFRMLAEVVAPPECVVIGQRVRIEWEGHDELSVPLFVPI